MKRCAFLLVTLAAAWGAAAAQLGYTVRSTELKSKPFADSPAVTVLAENKEVEIVQRRGAWFQVRAPEEGWVRMLALRMGSDALREGESGVGALFNVVRHGESGVTVATGVRGLSGEDIKNAKPDEEQLKKMHSYAVTAAQARVFSSDGGLAPRELAYLVSPATTDRQQIGKPEEK